MCCIDCDGLGGVGPGGVGVELENGGLATLGEELDDIRAALGAQLDQLTRQVGAYDRGGPDALSVPALRSVGLVCMLVGRRIRRVTGGT